MTIDFDSNKIPHREEREERVLDLHFNQNKNYRQIAKEMKMSLRDIGEIVNRAKEEKSDRNTSHYPYNPMIKGKTPLQVAIDLNIGQAQTTQYYSDYLKLIGLEDITKTCKEAVGKPIIIIVDIVFLVFIILIIKINIPNTHFKNYLFHSKKEF
jgi:hypothetical protein